MLYNNDKLKRVTHFFYQYNNNSFRRKSLPNDPLILFENWLKQAYKAKLIDPSAMIVSTVDSFCQPWQRIVLLKSYNKEGLIFYTNLRSRKARHIKENSRVSLLFPWYILQRQVMVIGKARSLSKSESIKYFYTRPRDNQIGTWASKQSNIISTRNTLESKFLKFKKKFKNKKVPFPNFWGGFCVSIKKIEFWQGNKHRLHDRFLYQRKKEVWKIDRLSP